MSGCRGWWALTDHAAGTDPLPPDCTFSTLKCPFPQLDVSASFSLEDDPIISTGAVEKIKDKGKSSGDNLLSSFSTCSSILLTEAAQRATAHSHVVEGLGHSRRPADMHAYTPNDYDYKASAIIIVLLMDSTV
ncbi:hypothetical protein MHYP_G00344220 [Metynnis hypsauchen]